MTEIKITVNKNIFKKGLMALVGLIVILTFFLFINNVSLAALTCTVSANPCNSPNVTVLKMYSASNSHAGSSTVSSYTQLVCCGIGATGLGTNCAGTYALLGTLSSADNAHFEDSLKANYSSANDVCLSVDSGTISVATSTSCASYDTTIFSMSGTSGTNAHVGDGTVYATKICGTATGAAPSLTFVVTTNNFSTLSPGSPVFATSTLNVNTNNTSGWNVTLSGNNVNLTAQTMNDGAGTEITDQDPQWIIPAAAATTTAGNAVAITNGNDVLAFRVMSASSTNGGSFLSTVWWGTSDAMFNAGQLWAGIASSTNVSRIGNAGTGSLSASDHLNTVQYYLDAPATKKSGTYTGTLTYTATVNP